MHFKWNWLLVNFPHRRNIHPLLLLAPHTHLWDHFKAALFLFPSESVECLILLFQQEVETSNFAEGRKQRSKPAEFLCMIKGTSLLCWRLGWGGERPYNAFGLKWEKKGVKRANDRVFNRTVFSVWVMSLILFPFDMSVQNYLNLRRRGADNATGILIGHETFHGVWHRAQQHQGF